MFLNVLLFIIETLFFVLFNAYLYEIMPALLAYFRIAYYVSHTILDWIILIVNYLVSILFIIIFPHYAMFGYFYIVLTTITLILFEL